MVARQGRGINFPLIRSHQCRSRTRWLKDAEKQCEATEAPEEEHILEMLSLEDEEKCTEMA